MDTNRMMKKIAFLEFANDQMETEIVELDELLKAIGFPEGVDSVKRVAQEMLEEGLVDHDPEEAA